ncbi:hypothetical protein EMCRGX_G013359 [Ephydatia muelleri]
MSCDAVQGTNDSSIASKLSMVNAGYFCDPYLKFFVTKSPRRAPIINSSLSMEGTVTDLSDASYCLSQETVETEEEHLSQDRDLDAKDIAGSKTYLVYESSLLRLMRKCYVWVKLLS